MAEGEAQGAAGAAGGPVAGIIIAITEAVDVTLDHVESAIDQQASLPVQINNLTRNWPKVIQGLKRTHEEYHALNDARKANVRWLQDSRNKRPWDAAGGHVQHDPLCSNPTWRCAYKDPAKAGIKIDQNKYADRELPKILRTRAPTAANELAVMDKSGSKNTGNVATYREFARFLQAYWLGLRVIAPIIQLQEGLTVPAPPATLLSPATLRLLYPSDTDARAGRVPYRLRDNYLNALIQAQAAGFLASDTPVPAWVLGFSDADGVLSTAMPTATEMVSLSRQWQAYKSAGAGTYGAYGIDTEAFSPVGVINVTGPRFGEDIAPLGPRFGGAPTDQESFSLWVRDLVVGGRLDAALVGDPAGSPSAVARTPLNLPPGLGRRLTGRTRKLPAGTSAAPPAPTEEGLPLWGRVLAGLGTVAGVIGVAALAVRKR